MYSYFIFRKFQIYITGILKYIILYYKKKGIKNTILDKIFMRVLFTVDDTFLMIDRNRLLQMEEKGMGRREYEKITLIFQK